MSPTVAQPEESRADSPAPTGYGIPVTQSAPIDDEFIADLWNAGASPRLVRHLIAKRRQLGFWNRLRLEWQLRIQGLRGVLHR